MRSLIILILLPLVFVSELVYSQTVNNPVNLIDGFKSYQSIEEIRQYCSSLGHKWMIIEDSNLPKGDKRPKFDIFVVEVKEFKYLDWIGVLRLEFFNNRLFGTSFYPEDYKAFIENLLQNEKIDLINNDKKIIDNLMIWKHKDYRGKVYIGWKDIRIEQEELEWIKKYS